MNVSLAELMASYLQHAGAYPVSTRDLGRLLTGLSRHSLRQQRKSRSLEASRTAVNCFF